SGGATPGLPLSDTLPPAVSTITLADDLPVADIQVGIQVTHSWHGDLEVDLSTPAGTTLRLHDHQGGSDPDLDLIWWEFGVPNGSAPYTCACTMRPAPGSFFEIFGESSAGTWSLSVADTVRNDVGTFDAWSIAISDVGPPPPIDGLACWPGLGTGVVDVSWSNPTTYDQLRVEVDGLPAAVLAGDATSYTTPGLPVATFGDIRVVGVVDGLSSMARVCTPYLPSFRSGVAVVFAGEQPGNVDSVAALSAALIASGRSVNVVDELTPASVGTPSSLWLCLGTYPAAHALSQAEGAYVRDLVVAGVPLYIEGADVWGFDDPTPLSTVDGVADGLAENGSGTPAFIAGEATVELDLSDLAAAYLPDQGGAESTDRLVRATSDALGPNTAVIWRTVPFPGQDMYDLGILYATNPPAGRVIAQSWEIGGFDGAVDTIVLRYLDTLSPLRPPSAPVFRRGDSNGDGSFDIADAIASLLYILGLGAPPITCLDAVDANDDGRLDIGDPIYVLSSLFEGGSPLPPAPGPFACSFDATADGLDCGFYVACP
ncbi:MAG: proprotein convertase P-domain-containing protein, partial [Planctomycetes bacterium]|nr:proprotein convertase P-domain-containing protein [Planctomycetota bacterium]